MQYSVWCRMRLKTPCNIPTIVRNRSTCPTRTDCLTELRKSYERWKGRVRALVNNAGIGRMGFLEQLSVRDIRLVVDTNFLSHAIVTRAFLPLLKRQGSGDIVFIGSESALSGGRQGSIYCASKFAIRGFAQSLREECGKSGGARRPDQSRRRTHAVLRRS